MDKNFYERFAKVQTELKAPKNQYNSFGKYKYRSCEDILESAKPLCCANGMILTISDEVESVGDRFYIIARAMVRDVFSDAHLCASAMAREEDTKKGMDGSQVTGTASSYARKYALNGLFCIDDTKDADTDEYTAKQNAPQKSKTDSKAKSQPQPQNASEVPQNAPQSNLVCETCGKVISDFVKTDGTIVSADKVYESCGHKCLACYNKTKKENK